MASATKVPEEVVAAADWAAIYVRLTAFARERLRGGAVEDAQRLARDAIRTLLDPESTVTWDHEREPDPMRCLGSIVNGLVRNHFRKKVTKAEVLTDDIEASSDDAFTMPDQERRLIAADMRAKILSRVLDLSDGDDLVQEIAVLAEEGVLDVAGQIERLRVPRSRIYEARRRFQERVDAVREELEEP